MAAIEGGRHAPPRTFFLNDPVVRGRFYQAVVAILVIAFVWWIVNNTEANLAAQNKTTGFDFLWKTAGFDISFSLFPFDRTSFYWQAFLVGLTNTVLVAIIGIVFATIAWIAAHGVSRCRSSRPPRCKTSRPAV